MYFLQAERSVTLEAELAYFRLVQGAPSNAFDRIDIKLDQGCSELVLKSCVAYLQLPPSIHQRTVLASPKSAQATPAGYSSQPQPRHTGLSR